MKRAPFTYGLDPSASTNGKRYFRSLDELAGSSEFQTALAREFPAGAAELGDGLSRRSFIGLMGASLGLAGLAGCRRPEELILPYAKQPEMVVPGRPERYATAMPFAGSALGLVVESHEGRPTKIEGNALHPDSLGGASAFAQASVLELYDTERSDGPREKGAKRQWEDAAAALKAHGEKARGRAGEGLAVLTREHRSPTVSAQLAALRREMPAARIVRYEPFSAHSVRAGALLAFGAPLETVLDPAKAKVLLALDADFLLSEGRAVRQARGFADGRRLRGEGARDMNRLYVAESTFTVTGAAADHRIALQSRAIFGFVAGLVKQLESTDAALSPELSAALATIPVPAAAGRFIVAVARDLLAHKGAGLIVAGQRQPPHVHALVHLLNLALGNTDRTVTHVKAQGDTAEGPAALTALAASMRAGEVETLLILDGNPVYDAPADAAFSAALANVSASFHLGYSLDETSAACTWHLDRAHYLEAWGDVRSADGTASVVQPLIAPLHGGKSDAEVLEMLLGGSRKGYELVRATSLAEHPTLATAAPLGDLTFETRWRRSLHDGLFEGSAFPVESVTARPADVASAIAKLGPPVPPMQSGGLEVSFQPDSHAWDGRFANNGWMQELPDPMTKLTWDNAALIAMSTAAELGVVDGDLLDITVDGRTVRVPVLVAPGQARGSVALTVGQGRKKVGSVGAGVGFDVGALRTSRGFGFAGATAQKANVLAKHKFAITQEHSAMEGRPIVREADLTRFIKEPEFARKEDEGPLFSLYDEYKYEGHKWGMTIDLNACIGCNGCMVACQSENNIPLVGKTGVIKSREMHWIRIDRYFAADKLPKKGLTHETSEMGEDVQAVMQPLTCQQCENAPCETVCPVGATTHSPEGLNDMAYNRCIGTRYCANNCPFKVRRFNFFNYNRDLPELRRMQFNPDVTVRARGVMEKCTYCVQRINEAKIATHLAGRDRVKDGEVVTACQQGCPTNAISFGDLNDAGSEVAKAAAEPRSYQLLAELNVRPRTSYLARVRNPNPELA